MEKIRVMLADDNLNLLRLLTDYLSRKPDIELVAAVSDGVEIPDAVRQFAPDILVMDIIMPRRDGFMTLEALSAMETQLRPRVIVLTGLARDDFIMRAIQLGASYYMVKPFDMGLLYERIVEVAREQPPATLTALPGEGPEESVDEQITNLFLTLGIPAHIKGYQYLREAVRMVLENHELINRITKLRTTDLIQRHFSRASESPCYKGVLTPRGASAQPGAVQRQKKQEHDDIIANRAKMSSCHYIQAKNVIL